MRRFAVKLLLLLAFPLDAVAQQSPSYALVNPPTPTRRYGMAGCGLGSVLLPNGPQVATSIINGLLWNQVFVISSGTSNCQNDSLQQVGSDQENFMKSNYRTIASEAAQGRGDSLVALAESLGCSPESHSAFASFTQKNHKKIFSKPGAIAALESLKRELKQEDALDGSCELVVSSRASAARSL
jgi:hypothetical protein